MFYHKTFCADSYNCAQTNDVCPYKLTPKIEKDAAAQGVILNTRYMAYGCECYIPLEQESGQWV